jgi:hypothetical protein
MEDQMKRKNPLLRMKLWLRRGLPDLEVTAVNGLDLEKKRKDQDLDPGKSADPGKPNLH